MNHIFTIYYCSADGHPGGFRFLAIVNRAAINTDEQQLYKIWSPLRICPGAV